MYSMNRDYLIDLSMLTKLLDFFKQCFASQDTPEKKVAEPSPKKTAKTVKASESLPPQKKEITKNKVVTSKKASTKIVKKSKTSSKAKKSKNKK